MRQNPSQFLGLVGRLDAELHDVSSIKRVCDPDDWSVGQALGSRLRSLGSNGVLYPSVRCPGGSCVGLFWPDVLQSPPRETSPYDFHWDGSQVDRVLRRKDSRILSLL